MYISPRKLERYVFANVASYKCGTFTNVASYKCGIFTNVASYKCGIFTNGVLQMWHFYKCGIQLPQIGSQPWYKGYKVYKEGPSVKACDC